MNQVFFKTETAFLNACNEHDAKLTTIYTGSGECRAGRISTDLVLVLSECDYNNAPFFERGE